MPYRTCYLTKDKLTQLERIAGKKRVTPYKVLKVAIALGLDDIEQQGEGVLRNEEGTGGSVSGTEEPDWRKFLKPDEGNAKRRRGKR